MTDEQRTQGIEALLESARQEMVARDLVRDAQAATVATIVTGLHRMLDTFDAKARAEALERLGNWMDYERAAS